MIIEIAIALFIAWFLIETVEFWFPVVMFAVLMAAVAVFLVFLFVLVG